MTAAAFAIEADGQRQKVLLGAEINRGGAAGRILALTGDPRRVAKLYHDEADAERARDRVLAMLSRPPSLKPKRLNRVEYVQLAWPDALIEDASGRALGFRMPRVPLDLALPLECLLHSAQRRAEGLPETYGLRVFAAANLASVLAELHVLGHHVVDLKPLNVYVYRETMFVAVIDCDGFSVAGPRQRFPAGHFSDEYRCPEGAGRPPQELGEAQDLFALAVIVFQLLNGGIHPFDGHPVPGASVPSSLQEKIDTGLYPYNARHSGLQPHAFSLYPRLEDATQRLLDRALATRSRPSAAEWRDHLRGLIEGNVLVRCVKDPDHAHFSKGCGLCAKESALRAAAVAQAAAPKPPPQGPAATAPLWGRRRAQPAAAMRAGPGRLVRQPRAAPGAVPVAPPAAATPRVGVADALVQAMLSAIKAGIGGGLVGGGLILAGLKLPLPLLALAVAVALVLIIGTWLDHRRGGGHRGLLAGLSAVVPMAAIFPETYHAAGWLPPPLALAVVAALAALLPGFAFSYLRPATRSRRRGWALTTRRWAGAMAGIILLLACQIAAVAWLDVAMAGPQAERPALTYAVLAAVNQARQSIAEAMDRAGPEVQTRSSERP
jgi:hypothetical protein